MLTQEEMLKIQQLSEQNPEVDYIIKRLNEESKFMLSKLSHEIRNPLTLISSTLQIMELKNPDLSKIKYWSQVRSDVNDVILLLNDLSTYNNSDKLTITPVNLSCMIHDIADSFESASLESNNKISICIHESALSYISAYPCDKIKLKQVFINIIKNAFEAMDAGDSLAISLRVSEAKEHAFENGSKFGNLSLENISKDNTQLKIASLDGMSLESDAFEEDSFGGEPFDGEPFNDDPFDGEPFIDKPYNDEPSLESSLQDSFEGSFKNSLGKSSLENSPLKISSFDSTSLNNTSFKKDNEDSNHLVITISNNGIPIPPDHLDTLFEPFITHKSSGTGLGLAISNKIIMSHGGNISVQSTEELTSFIITLPIRH